MKQLRSVLVFAALVLIAVASFAQNAPKKEYTFHGKVVSVDKNAKALSVNGEKVEGWMDAMTMNYRVDDPSIFDKVKAGDQITATVYDGDYSLHKVKIVSPAPADSKSKK